MSIFLRNLEVPVSTVPEKVQLAEKVASTLGVGENDIDRVEIVKKSLDARKKSRIVYRYQVDVSLKSGKTPGLQSELITEPPKLKGSYEPLKDIPDQNFTRKPVIIGSGPAGIFAALTLISRGQPSIIVERGEPVESRIRSVNHLRQKLFGYRGTDEGKRCKCQIHSQ